MQVADCYIHVKYRRLHPGEFESLSEYLLTVATELSQNVKRGRESPPHYSGIAAGVGFWLYRQRP